MAWSLVVLPLAAAVLTFLVGRSGPLSALTGVAGGVGTLVLSVIALAGAPAGVRGAPFAEEHATGPGLVMGGTDLPLGLGLSATSAFLVLVVALVTALVQAYACLLYTSPSPRD